MSDILDRRVIEMDFDNAKFQRLAGETLDTLDKLDKKLDNLDRFDDVLDKLDEIGDSKSFSNLQKQSDGLTFAAAIASLDGFTQKFSVLHEVAVGALRRIGEQITDTAERLVKGLSIDQVSAGWEKYNELSQSTATIYNSIKDSDKYNFADNSEALDYTEKQLKKLAWFTDETSYNFTDMTDNIGKFVGNNILLDDAVDSMMGIAQWAATAGANVQQASHAMYNISQAMGVGYMSLMDWKSIENAQMATAAFKQTVLDTAEAMGLVQEKVDGHYLIKTIEDEIANVSLETFSANLSSKSGKWFTKDLLTEVLKRYGSFSTELYNFYDEINETGQTYVTTSEILSIIDDFKAGAKDVSALAGDTGLSIEYLTERLETLSSDYYSLGMSSFQAAQEAKTFQEAIDATKDAVSTQWMQIFKLIFGNYIEAKELWTDFANSLWDVFAGPLDEMREMIAEWKDFEEGGRDDFIEGLYNSWEALVKIMDAVKEGFREVFPAKTVDDLANIVKRFKEWSEALLENEELFGRVRKTAELFAKVLKIVGTVYKVMATAIITFIGRLTPVFDLFVHYLSDLANSLAKATIENDSFMDKLNKVIDVITYIPEKIAKAIDIFVTFIKVVKETREMFNTRKFLDVKIDDVIAKFSEMLYLVDASGGRAKKVVDFFAKAAYNINYIIQLFKVFNKVKKDVKESFERFGEGAEDLDSIVQRFRILLGISGEAGEKLDKTIERLSKIVLKLTDIHTGTGNFLHSIGVFFDVMAERITAFLSGIPLGEFGKNVASVFNMVYHTIRDCIEKIIRYFRKSKDESDEFVDGLVDSGRSLQEVATVGEKMVGFWHTVWVAIKDIGSTIWKFTIELIDGLLNAIANFISKADFDSVLRGLSLFDFWEFMKTLNNVIDTFADSTATGKVFTFGENISNLLRRMAQSFKAFTFEVYTEGFENIAQSLIEIAIAAFILASLDADKIAASVGAIAAIFAEMVTAVAVLSRGSKSRNLIDVAVFQMLSKVINKMATSILVLSVALATVLKASGGDPQKLFAAVTVISVLLGEMVGVMHAIKSVDFKLFNGISRVAKGMATAISIMAIAISTIVASLDGKEDALQLLAAATLSITQLIASLAGALVIISKFGKISTPASIALTLVIGVLTLFMKVSLTIIERLADLREKDAVRAVALFSALYTVLISGISIISAISKQGMNVLFVLSMLSIIDFIDTAVDSVIKLSEYDQGKIWSAVGVIAALSGIIILISKLSTIVATDKTDFDGMLVPLIALILSLSILLHQIDKISRNDPASIKAAAIVLALSTVAIGAFVALLSYMKKRSKAFKNAKENLKSLIVIAGLLFAVSLSLALLTAPLMALAAMPIAKMIVTMIGIAALMSIMAAISRKTKDANFKDAGVLALSFIALGVGLSALAPALMKMALVPFNGLAKGLITIAGAMGLLMVGALLNNMLNLTDTILGFAAAMALFGLGVDLFAHGVEHLARAAVIIMDSAEVFAAALATFVKGLIVGLVEAVYSTSDTIKEIALKMLFDVVEDFIKNIPDLTRGALEGFIQMLGILIDYVPDIVDKIMTLVFLVLDKLIEYIPGIVKRVVDIILTIFAAIPQALRESEVDMEDVVAGFDIFKEFLKKMAELALYAVPAIIGILAFVVVTAETIGAFLLLGKLFEATNTDLVEKGGELVGLLGRQIAKFVEAFGAITPEAIAGVQAICGMLLTLAGANLINAIASFIGGGDNITLETLGYDLASFGESLAKFAESTNGVDFDDIKTAAEAMKMVASIYEELPRIGGFAQAFAGTKMPLNMLGKQMEDIGPALAKMSASITGEHSIDVDAVKNGASALVEIAKIYNELPRTGGAGQWWAGEKLGLDAFAKQITDLGPSLADFSTSITGEQQINVDAIKGGAEAALEIAKVYSELPRTGGVWQSFIGEKKTLSKFGEELAAMAPHLKTFSENSEGVNAESVDVAINVAKMIAGMYEYMPRQGGVLQSLIGTTKSLGTFGQEMGVLSEKLLKFMTTISSGSYDKSNIDTALSVVQMLADIQSILPWEFSNWIQAAFGHNMTLGDFGKGLNDLAGPIGDFMATIGNDDVVYNEKHIKTATYVLKCIGTLYDSIKDVNVGGISSVFAGDPDLATFGEGLKGLGPGVAEYITTIDDKLSGKTIDESMINTATNIAIAAAGMYKALDGVTFGGISSVFTGSVDLGVFGEQLAKLGPGIAEFADKTKNVDPATTTSAAAAAAVIAGVLVNLEDLTNVKEQGFLGEVYRTLFGTPISIKDFCSKMVELGVGIADFAKELDEVPETISTYKMRLYVNILVMFADLLKQLEDIDNPNDEGVLGAIGAWLTGGSFSITAFMDVIISWAKKLKDFAKEMQDLTEEDSKISLQAIIDMIGKLQELANVTTEGLADKYSDLYDATYQLDYALQHIIAIGSLWSKNFDAYRHGITVIQSILSLSDTLNTADIKDSIGNKAEKLVDVAKSMEKAAGYISDAGDYYDDDFKNGIEATNGLVDLCKRLDDTTIPAHVNSIITQMAGAAKDSIKSFSNEFDFDNKNSEGSRAIKKVESFVNKVLSYFDTNKLGTVGADGAKSVVDSFLQGFDLYIGDNSGSIREKSTEFMSIIAEVFASKEHINTISMAAIDIRNAFVNAFSIIGVSNVVLQPIVEFAQRAIDILTSYSNMAKTEIYGRELRDKFVEPFNKNSDSFGVSLALAYVTTFCVSVVGAMNNRQHKNVAKDAGAALRDSFISAFKRNTNIRAYDAAVKVVKDYINNIVDIIKNGYYASQNYVTLMNNTTNAAQASINNFVNSISNYDRINTAITGLINSISNSFKTQTNLNTFKQLGEFAASGIADGISNSNAAKKVAQATTKIASRIPSQFKEALLIGSPSKVMADLASWVIPGICQGIDNSLYMLDDEAKAMTNPLTEALNAFDQVVDVDPTITPTLDLSEIMAGTVKMAEMLQQSFGINASFAAMASNAMVPFMATKVGAFTENGNSQSVTYNFTQNNTSPKALSEIDIYRKTNDELRWGFSKVQRA